MRATSFTLVKYIFIYIYYFVGNYRSESFYALFSMKYFVGHYRSESTIFDVYLTDLYEVTGVTGKDGHPPPAERLDQGHTGGVKRR